MEKKPKLVEFDQCLTEVEFNTDKNSVIMRKSFFKGDNFLKEDIVILDLCMMTLQTALSVAAEYVRNVTLVEYVKE